MAMKPTKQEKAALEAILDTAPTDQQKSRIVEARTRVEARTPELETRVLKSEAGKVAHVASPHNDHAGHCEHQKDAFGTSSAEFSGAMYGELATISARQKGVVDEKALNAVLAVVDGARPNNEVEAQLIVQMASTHLVAMDVLTRSKFASTAEGMQLYGNLAIKLLRTYTSQMELLAKIGRGPQVVEVRHVHVYPGAQAIVGDVHQHPGGGSAEENERQPHELSLGNAIGTTVRGEEPAGDALPVSRGEGQAAMPVARRRQG